MEIVDLDSPDKSTPLIKTWKCLEDELRCEICRSLLDAPMALRCSHVFCSFCIRKFLEFHKTGNCPSCKTSACSSDLKPEPRLASILNLLRRNNFRKKLRAKLTGSSGENLGRNAVFARQTSLENLFKRGGTLIGRETLPSYKGLTEKSLRALFKQENLPCEFSWGYDDLVRYHKEFIFQIQSVSDGSKMRIFEYDPTREGVQIFWASEMKKMYGNLNFARAVDKPQTVDLFLSAQHATAAALLNFQVLREEVLRKRKREESSFGLCLKISEKMLKASTVARSGQKSLVETLVPGYKDRVWAMISPDIKKRYIAMENASFEKSIESHKRFQDYFVRYKAIEDKMAPSSKFRKPAVDWRRQLARGTLHFGKFFEGPYGSDYRPGRSFDRLKEAIPFSEVEWEERKRYRSWDALRVAFLLWGLFFANRVTQNYPVVWC